jgi:hypothetical protein
MKSYILGLGPRAHWVEVGVDTQVSPAGIDELGGTDVDEIDVVGGTDVGVPGDVVGELQRLPAWRFWLAGHEPV